jgi:hypothetical protein
MLPHQSQRRDRCPERPISIIRAPVGFQVASLPSHLPHCMNTARSPPLAGAQSVLRRTDSNPPSGFWAGSIARTKCAPLQIGFGFRRCPSAPAVPHRRLPEIPRDNRPATWESRPHHAASSSLCRSASSDGTEFERWNKSPVFAKSIHPSILLPVCAFPPFEEEPPSFDFLKSEARISQSLFPVETL